MYAVLKPKMDKALSSEVGIRIINEDYLKILDKKVNDVSKLLVKLVIQKIRNFFSLVCKPKSLLQTLVINMV